MVYFIEIIVVYAVYSVYQIVKAYFAVGIIDGFVFQYFLRKLYFFIRRFYKTFFLFQRQIEIFQSDFKLGEFIAIGKRADFVVLSDDILKVKPDDIKDIEVEMTVVGGIVEYSASRT